MPNYKIDEASVTFSPDTDGVNHINVYSAGKTELGRRLSNFSNTFLDHPELGHFMSAEGLWYWLTRRDEKLRELHGFDAKKLGRSLPVVVDLPAGEFQRLMLLGLKAKLDFNHEIRSALRASSLPLTHYYFQAHGGGAKRVITPKGGEWILAFFEADRLKARPEADRRNMDAIEAMSQAVKKEDQLSLF